MTEKIIPRKELEQMMAQNDIIRNAASAMTPGFTDALHHRINLAQKIGKKTGLDWLALVDLLECIFLSKGLKPNATMEDVERVLSVLGWQVSDK